MSRLARSGGGGRRDLRDRLRGGAAGARGAAIEAINRCGAPVVACDIASGVDASSGEVAGVAVEADLTVSFHAAKLGQRIAPGKWHTGELRVAPIGIPAGAPGEAGRRDDRPGGAGPGAAPRGPHRPSSAPARWRSPVARAASPGRCGCPRWRRSGPAPATPPWPSRPTSSRSSKRAEPEVMSVGCPGGDGCLAPASAKAVLRAFEPAAAGVLGPGLGRDPGSFELARELVGGRSRRRW